MKEAIGEQTIEKTLAGISDMLYSYLPSMNRAFLEQDELAVSIAIKVRPHKSGTMVNYNLSFVESRVKDGDSIVIDEKQIGLPFTDDAIKATKEFVDSVPKGTVVELSTGGRSVKINGGG